MICACACVVAAIACLSPRLVLGHDAGGSRETAETAVPELVAPEKPGLREPPREGNPLARIPLSSLSATRERPLFSASRRPTAPPPASPAAIAKSSPPAEPERPPLTLQGAAIGKPRDIAVFLDETSKGSIRLHVGEEAEGWRLRSVDRRTATLEKDSLTVVLSFPAPVATPPNPTAFASDRPNMRDDRRPRAKTGANWISMAHVVY
jgi:hypothetical protein